MSGKKQKEGGGTPPVEETGAGAGTLVDLKETVILVVDAWKTDWNARVGGFANAVGKTQTEVETALKTVVGEPGEAALEALADAEASPNTDIKTALAGLTIPSAIFNKNVNLLRGPKTAAPAGGVNAAGPDMAAISSTVLPQVPNDTSFTQMLLVGGVLKVSTTEVLSAIRAGLGDTVDLFGLPALLKTKMADFATKTDQPCGEEYFRLRTMITKRRYADVFRALGIEGQFMTESMKNAFLDRVRSILWPSLYSFHQQLTSWNEGWMKSAGNPAIMFGAIASLAGGSKVLPPGIMAPPDTSPVRDAGTGTIDKINKVFAGPGIPVARALAYEAQQIRSILDEPGLPAAVGSTTRELMLRELEVNVSPDFVRMEINLARYALSVMELPKVASGNDELIYLAAMVQLGMTIPWQQLTESVAPNRNSDDSDEDQLEGGEDNPRGGRSGKGFKRY